jgi:hypothetical protein
VTNKDILNRVFTKYERMKKIFAYYQEVPPHAHQRLTQQIDEVKVQTSSGPSPVDKAIIRRDDAEYYIKLIDKAIEQLPNTQQKPFQTIIHNRYRRKPSYSSVRAALTIGFSVDAYFKKLRQAEAELVEIIDLWGINY